MKAIKTILTLVVTILPTCLNGQVITPEELNSWPFYGQGTKLVESHNMFFMKEAKESNGVMIVSPESYGADVVVKYDIMTLTPASVLVAILSASNPGKDASLSIPENYDGSMKLWIEDVESYFYAFRNGPHNYTPFIRKYPAPKGQDPALVSYEKNIMHPGVFYSIEIGRKKDVIWLKLDGEKILETTDKKAYGGGHFAFRIRGTAGEYAACLIRNVEVVRE
ncbi:DUF6250 domain-containing protein [Saccharicrinis sp. 156]|uniref:DUF6250 domain-containing protein n=1 Tax=Saccharicrinis sp. 156 TaxID=3417574 RepID=UPI003D341082